MTRYLRNQFFGPVGTDYDNFSTQNRPSESRFKKLFASIGWIKEKDDTATTTTQGFAKISGDVKAADYDSTLDSDGFTKVLVAHHLPFVISENQYSLGTDDSAISVRVVYNDRYRTGGDGRTFIIQNTLAITSDSPIIEVTQGNPGENASLDVNDVALNAAIESSASFQALEETVTTSIATTITGKIGEVKMYSFFNEHLGDTNSEFDEAGIGRAEDVEGATGGWSGWVVLAGQLASSITGADPTILTRYTSGSNLVDTRQKYPAGIDKDATDVGARTGFGAVGSNAHTLTVLETPIRSHLHDIDSTSNATISVSVTGGAHTHLLNITKNVVSTDDYVVGFNSPNNPTDKEDTFSMHQISGSNIDGYSELCGGVWSHPEKDWGDITSVYTGNAHQNIDDHPSLASRVAPNFEAYAVTEPGHTHTVTSSLGGSTEEAEVVGADEHENRPSTFMVAFAVYVGATGSTN